jgi:ferredoxin
MEEYNLESDPCDYRLIRINNCIQCLACLCHIAALIDENLRQLAYIVDRIADLVYHMTSGCMTAQVAYEVDYHLSHQGAPSKMVYPIRE